MRADFTAAALTIGEVYQTLIERWEELPRNLRYVATEARYIQQSAELALDLLDGRERW